jgi:hypothetical protein
VIFKTEILTLGRKLNHEESEGKEIEKNASSSEEVRYSTHEQLATTKSSGESMETHWKA